MTDEQAEKTWKEAWRGLSDEHRLQITKSLVDTFKEDFLEKLEDSFAGEKLPSNEWRALDRMKVQLARYPHAQQKTVEAWEEDWIVELRDGPQKYSVGDVAWIIGRSKSTVFEVLKRRGINQGEN